MAYSERSRATSVHIRSSSVYVAPFIKGQLESRHLGFKQRSTRASNLAHSATWKFLADEFKVLGCSECDEFVPRPVLCLTRSTLTSTHAWLSVFRSEAQGLALWQTRDLDVLQERLEETLQEWCDESEVICLLQEQASWLAPCWTRIPLREHREADCHS